MIATLIISQKLTNETLIMAITCHTTFQNFLQPPCKGSLSRPGLRKKTYFATQIARAVSHTLSSLQTMGVNLWRVLKLPNSQGWPPLSLMNMKMGSIDRMGAGIRNCTNPLQVLRVDAHGYQTIKYLVLIYHHGYQKSTTLVITCNHGFHSLKCQIAA